MIQFQSDISIVEAQEGGFVRPPSGGYILVITDVVSTFTKKQPARPMLELSLDVIDGEYANAFSQYPLKNYQLFDEKSMGRFKGFLNTILQCNPNAISVSGFQFEEQALKGLLIGGVIYEEEYEPGKVSMRISYLTSIEKIKTGKFVVPSRKVFAGPQNSSSQANTYTPNNDGLPF